ncbi:hypothetical protein D3C76_1716160 [compost metagenome]
MLQLRNRAVGMVDGFADNIQSVLLVFYIQVSRFIQQLLALRNQFVEALGIPHFRFVDFFHIHWEGPP